MRNLHDGVSGVLTRVSKSIHDHIIKLQAGINCEFKIHMESRLLESELLGKCGVFWSQMAAKVEVFHLNLVITTYG